jgi:1-acyl-sn-glycerol-3-phosphate acyltransferase
MTIDGAYDVLPRNATFPRPGHIKVTIHKPILTAGLSEEEMANVITQSRDAIASALPEKNK